MKLIRRSFVPLLAMAALFFATLACNAAAGTPTPGFSALETMVAATLQAAPSQASPIPTFAMPTALPTQTSVPPTLAPPTYAAPATATVTLPGATRIYFATGSTESVVTGTIGAGQTATYVVKAQQGQPLLASADSPDQSVDLAIFGANGVALLPASLSTSSWQGILPATQDYYFQVMGGSTTQNFTLNVIIAARVQFASGEVKTVVNGSTVNGFAVSYAAYAQKGQKMDVILTVNGDNAGLTIWGFSDGQPYARAQNGVQDFSMVLPSTQDYMIEVVPQAGRVVDYSVLIKIK
jgi:hypothetical protein